MLDSVTAEGLINPGMPVVDAEDGAFGFVDHLEGTDYIKLKKDDSGQHHLIPLAWVQAVDDKVHIDRSAEDIRREWKTKA